MEIIKRIGPWSLLVSIPFFIGGFFYRPLFYVVLFLWYTAVVSYIAFRFISSRNVEQPTPMPVKKVRTVSPRNDKLEKMLVATGKHLVQFLAFIGKNLAQVLSFVWKHAMILLAELFVWVWQNKVLSWLIGSGITLFVAIAISWWGLSFASFLSIIAAGTTMAKQWKQVGDLVWKVICKFPVMTLMVFFFLIGVIGIGLKSQAMAFFGVGAATLLFFAGIIYFLKKPTDAVHEALEKKFFSKEK